MGRLLRGGPPKGFTAVEVLVGLVVLAILTAVGLPLLTGSVADYRFRAAVNRIVADARLARQQAISTGWEYRLYGYNAASSTKPSQYRIEGRRDSSLTWPALTDGIFKSADREAGAWFDIGESYLGVRLNEGDPGADFWVSFNAKGAASGITTGFQPLRVKGRTGALKSIEVVVATGSVKTR
jgi:prepilin-type N-terminal cleavage/methylation domain-containing protein